MKIKVVLFSIFISSIFLLVGCNNDITNPNPQSKLPTLSKPLTIVEGHVYNGRQLVKRAKVYLYKGSTYMGADYTDLNGYYNMRINGTSGTYKVKCYYKNLYDEESFYVDKENGPFTYTVDLHLSYWAD